MYKMTQAEVLELLNNNKNKYFSSEEISNNIKTNKTSIEKNLRMLRRYNLIEVKFIKSQFNVSKLRVYKYKENED